MIINSLKTAYLKYPNYKKDNKVINPVRNDYFVCDSKTSFMIRNITFLGRLPNSTLINSGFKPVTVENNKITSKEDKLIIDTPQKFIALINSPDVWNKNIVLTNDIDLGGAQIKPMGNNSKPFKGEFDGNGHKISNFRIKAEDSYNVGLFGKCENAKLTGIEITDAYISGKQQVGGLAGYAVNSEIKDCSFDGYIEGEKKLGGLVGLSKQNSIQGSSTDCTVKSKSQNRDNVFESDNRAFITASIIGGLLGSDEGSTVDNSYSYGTLTANEQAGGLVGYADKTEIRNSCFNGKIGCENKAGGLIGWATNANIANSYALSNKNNIIGSDINSTVSMSYSNLDDITSKPARYWDSNIWNLYNKRLPRLKFQAEKMSAEATFLEDINIDIKNGNIGYKYNFNNVVNVDVKFDLLPPKHYPENDEKLKAIKECQNTNKLRKMFGAMVLNIIQIRENDEDDSKYDELLLAFEQNPKMDFNTRYTENDGYNINCTPLFILTSLNKAYILQQALKRNDVDVNVGSGPNHNRTVLNQAITRNIDASAYVLLKDPKMDEYIEKDLDLFKASNPSNFIKLLLELYPDIPEYNSEKRSVEFSKEFDIPAELLEPLTEVSTLQDAQRTIDIDKNYRDSRGNNIINVAATIDNEEDALKVLLTAKKLGTDVNNWNQKSESPIGHAIYDKKPHLTAQLLGSTNSPFLRVGDGTDAMLLFSNFPYENYAINYMEIARKRGLSINSRDNEGNTPLINAIRMKQYNKIKYLLSNGANPNLYDNAKQTPLHHACINNDKKAIEILLDSYAYPNIKDELGNLPLDYLDEEIKNEILQKFDDHNYLYQVSGIDDDYEGNYKICNLDEYNHIQNNEHFAEVVNEINNSSDNCDKSVLQLTKNAISNPNIKYLKDHEGNNLLHIAASAKSFYAKECIKAAIESGFDINSLNDNKETPLQSALNSYLCAGTVEEKLILMQNIKFLLDNNPNVDLADNNEQSALHKVCQTGNLILFNEILKHNPKINQIDVLGKTPFEYIPFEADTPMYLTFEQYLKNYKILKEKK